MKLLKVRVCIVLTGTLISLTSCSSSTDPESANVRISLAAAEFGPGETVVSAVTNLTRKSLGYGGGFCPTSLHRQGAGGDWILIGPSPQGQVCTMDLHTLEPYATAEHRYRLPSDLAPGIYRLELSPPHPREGPIGRLERLTTPNFTVRNHS